MSSNHLLRIKKLKGQNILLEALKHNKRELHAERGAGANINYAKSHLNYSLTEANNATNIDRLAKAQMALAGIFKPRINAVMVVEILISLPVDRHQQDTRQFFNDCFNWIKETFNGELLSFDVHLDESAPHAHALILPLIDGKMNGSDLVGGKVKFKKTINSFHLNVARHYGLSCWKKLKVSEKGKLIKEIFIKLDDDTAKKSKIWHLIDADIRRNPMPYADALSIGQVLSQVQNAKSFVDIKRSRGKGVFER